MTKPAAGATATPQDKERARELIDEWDAGDGILVDKVASALARVRRETLEEAADTLEAVVRAHTPVGPRQVALEAMVFILERAVSDLRRSARSLMEQAAGKAALARPPAQPARLNPSHFDALHDKVHKDDGRLIKAQSIAAAAPPAPQEGEPDAVPKAEEAPPSCALCQCGKMRIPNPTSGVHGFDNVVHRHDVCVYVGNPAAAPKAEAETSDVD